MPTPKPQHRPLATILALSSVLLGGCRDAPPTPPTSPTSPEAGPSRVYQDCDPYSQQCPCDPNAIIGGCSSDPGDTHVSADITLRTSVSVSTTEPIYDPNTGQETTSFQETAPDVHAHVDGGYTYAGDVTVATQFTDGPDAAHTTVPQTVAADLTADNLTEVNSSNQALTDTPPAELNATSPMALVGTTQNGDVTAGWLVDQDTPVTISESRDTPGGLVASRAAAAVDAGAVARRAFVRAVALAERGSPQLAVLNGTPVKVDVSAPGRLTITDDDALDQTAIVTPPAKATARSQASRREAGKHARTFVKVDVDDEGNPLARNGKRTLGRKLWVLAEDRNEVDVDDGVRTIHQEHVATFTRVKWYRNPVRDASRRAARPTTDWIPLPGTTPGGSAASTRNTTSVGHGPSALASSGSRAAIRAPTAGPLRLVACDNECVSGGYVPPIPAPIGADPGCDREIQAHVNPSGAVNLLFQHGIWSEALTWCDNSDYLRVRFVVGNEVRHSLSNVASYETQAGELESHIQQDAQAGYGGPYVLIGHSNGGIVSRYTAQEYGGDPSVIRGVITVDSPHAGAPLVTNARKATLVALLAVPAISNLSCRFVQTFLCDQGNLLVSETGFGLLAALSPLFVANNPVLRQMTPGSSFHSQINGRGDPFPHAAVVNVAWNKWTPWRLMGDKRYCGSVQSANGVPYYVGPRTPNCGDLSRLFVDGVDKTYHRYIKCSIVGGILGFVLPGGHAVAALCAKNAAGLKVPDLVYRRLSVGTRRGDGVVPEESQNYPDGSQPFIVPDGDSHLGVTHSRFRTGFQIGLAMNRRMGVPFAQ